MRVNRSPTYADNGQQNRTEINPPAGFQSIHLKYRWTSPLAQDLQDPTTWSSNELYAIRPIIPDDPEYDT